MVTNLSADLWTEFDEKARSQEDVYERAATAQFAAEAKAVLQILESSVPQIKSTLDDALARSILWPYIEGAFLKILAAYTSAGLFYRQWYNRMRPLVAKTMAGADASVNVRVRLIGPTSPQVVSAINRRVTKLAASVTETTADQIRAVMIKAREDGVGVTELARRIRTDVFADTITTARSRTIARTETVGALNEGAMVKARASGVFRSKHWISQGDGRVRDSHRTAEAEGWIAIDLPYSNGLDYPHAPGSPAEEVVNCRCSQTFSDLTPDEANAG